jgi:Ran GTPase-activating protein (RanGAP) involved in mRNA processing and transport
MRAVVPTDDAEDGENLLAHQAVLLEQYVASLKQANKSTKDCLSGEPLELAKQYCSLSMSQSNVSRQARRLKHKLVDIVAEIKDLRRDLKGVGPELRAELSVELGMLMEVHKALKAELLANAKELGRDRDAVRFVLAKLAITRKGLKPTQSVKVALDRSRFVWVDGFVVNKAHLLWKKADGVETTKVIERAKTEESRVPARDRDEDVSAAAEEDVPLAMVGVAFADSGCRLSFADVDDEAEQEYANWTKAGALKYSTEIHLTQLYSGADVVVKDSLVGAEDIMNCVLNNEVERLEPGQKYSVSYELEIPGTLLEQRGRVVETWSAANNRYERREIEMDTYLTVQEGTHRGKEAHLVRGPEKGMPWYRIKVAEDISSEHLDLCPTKVDAVVTPEQEHLLRNGLYEVEYEVEIEALFLELTMDQKLPQLRGLGACGFGDVRIIGGQFAAKVGTLVGKPSLLERSNARGQQSRATYRVKFTDNFTGEHLRFRASVFWTCDVLHSRSHVFEIALSATQHQNRVLEATLSCADDGELRVHFAEMVIRAAAAGDGIVLLHTEELVPQQQLVSESVLLTGHAASGKTTFARQCVHALACACLADHDASNASTAVPVLIPVVQIAQTIKDEGLIDSPDADILKRYLELQHSTVAPLLLEMRAQRRLVVVLDGLDEAGKCRDTLEKYASCRLATEVKLCVTGREQGIKHKNIFRSFCTADLKGLTPKQQASVIEGRFSKAKIEGGSTSGRIKAFTEKIRTNASLAGLASNPLLLNLLVTQHMSHEREGRTISFEGRCVADQKEYVASFPGCYKREWDRVSSVLQGRSVACVFTPEAEPAFGKHSIDDESPGKCFCETMLYHDAPEEKRKELGFIVDETNLHFTGEMPKVGKQIEVEVQLDCWKEARWWVCTVLEVSISTNGIRVAFDGLDRVRAAGWVQLEQINMSGRRKTIQRPGQAQWGCEWYSKWRDNVSACEAAGQTAIVVFKKGKQGEETHDGLGLSQWAEVEYLKRHYYSDGTGKTMRQMDVAEFGKCVAMNRAQIYQEVVDGVLRQYTGGDSSYLTSFLEELCFRVHTQEGAQYEVFDEAFLQYELFDRPEQTKSLALVQVLLESLCCLGAQTAAKVPLESESESKEAKRIWKELHSSVRASRFPLLAWVPDGKRDNFTFSHLSFQEYFCASYIVRQVRAREDLESCAVFASTVGVLQDIDALLGSDRFQTIVQMARELLSGELQLLESFAYCFLPESSEGVISIHQNLGTTTAAMTLFSLVSCLPPSSSSSGIVLDLSGSGLNGDAIAGWLSCLQQYPHLRHSIAGMDVSNNELKEKGAKAMCRILGLHSRLRILNLADARLGSKGARHLADSLGLSKSLVSLDLEGNNIGPQGARYLSTALGTNHTLTRLNIRKNCIADEGKAVLSLALTTSTCCLQYLVCDEWALEQDTTVLDVSNTLLVATDAVLLGSLLTHNRRLTALNILKNPGINDTGLKAIEAAFKESPSLTSICGATGPTLDLSGQGLGADDACVIAVELKYNCTLVALILADNSLARCKKDTRELNGLILLGEAIADNASLSKLDISCNQLEADGARLIANALKKNVSTTFPPTRNPIDSCFYRWEHSPTCTLDILDYLPLHSPTRSSWLLLGQGRVPSSWLSHHHSPSQSLRRSS